MASDGGKRHYARAVMVGPWRATTHIELGDLRIAGALMLGAAAVRPLVRSPGVPCPLRALTGVPCPLCGMTTSVTDTVWLDVPSAVAANPMGVVAVAAVIALWLAWLVGRRVGRRVERVAVPVLLLPLMLLAMWLFELHRFDYL